MTTVISSRMIFYSKFAKLLFLRTSSIPSKESFFLVLFISLKRSHLSRASFAKALAICEGSSGFLKFEGYSITLKWNRQLLRYWRRPRHHPIRWRQTHRWHQYPKLQFRGRCWYRPCDHEDHLRYGQQPIQDYLHQPKYATVPAIFHLFRFCRLLW